MTNVRPVPFTARRTNVWWSNESEESREVACSAVRSVVLDGPARVGLMLERALLPCRLSIFEEMREAGRICVELETIHGDRHALLFEVGEPLDIPLVGINWDSPDAVLCGVLFCRAELTSSRPRPASSR